MKLIRISAIWCTSCIITHSLWQEIKEKYNFKYEEYDYDMDEEIVKKYDIGKILPVIIVENNNRIITKIIGEKSKKEVFQILDNIKE